MGSQDYVLVHVTALRETAMRACHWHAHDREYGDVYWGHSSVGAREVFGHAMQGQAYVSCHYRVTRVHVLGIKPLHFTRV